MKFSITPLSLMPSSFQWKASNCNALSATVFPPIVAGLLKLTATLTIVNVKTLASSARNTRSTLTFHIAQIRPTFQRGVRTPAFFPCIVQFQPNDAVHRRFAAAVHAQVKVTRIAFLIATFQCVTQFNPGIWVTFSPSRSSKVLLLHYGTRYCCFTLASAVLLMSPYATERLLSSWCTS